MVDDVPKSQAETSSTLGQTEENGGVADTNGREEIRRNCVSELPGHAPATRGGPGDTM